MFPTGTAVSLACLPQACSGSVNVAFLPPAVASLPPYPCHPVFAVLGLPAGCRRYLLQGRPAAGGEGEKFGEIRQLLKCVESGMATRDRDHRPPQLRGAFRRIPPGTLPPDLGSFMCFSVCTSPLLFSLPHHVPKTLQDPCLSDPSMILTLR